MMDANSGEPWSAMDVWELKGRRHGRMAAIDAQD
jgi:hypothetical protein